MLRYEFDQRGLGYPSRGGPVDAEGRIEALEPSQVFAQEIVFHCADYALLPSNRGSIVSNFIKLIEKLAEGIAKFGPRNRHLGVANECVFEAVNELLPREGVSRDEIDCIRKYAISKFSDHIPTDLFYFTVNRTEGLRRELKLEKCDVPSIVKEVKDLADLLTSGIKELGADNSVIKLSTTWLGIFVSKDLAGDVRFKDLIPELKAYYIQKVHEVKEVSA
jgi:hypothetical protein